MQRGKGGGATYVCVGMCMAVVAVLVHIDLSERQVPSRHVLHMLPAGTSPCVFRSSALNNGSHRGMSLQRTCAVHTIMSPKPSSDP